MPLRLSRSVLAAAAVAIPLAVYASEEFVTAKGKTVAMPEISTMTCAEIEMTLARIDATRYRENAPTNPDPADDALFIYEQDLAHALFEVCVMKPRAVPDDGEADPSQEQASNQ